MAIRIVQLGSSFEAQADLAYSVQSRTNLQEGNWMPWQQISAAVTNRTVNLTNAGPSVQQSFFRVVTPP